MFAKSLRAHVPFYIFAAEKSTQKEAGREISLEK